MGRDHKANRSPKGGSGITGDFLLLPKVTTNPDVKGTLLRWEPVAGAGSGEHKRKARGLAWLFSWAGRPMPFKRLPPTSIKVFRGKNEKK